MWELIRRFALAVLCSIPWCAPLWGAAPLYLSDERFEAFEHLRTFEQWSVFGASDPSRCIAASLPTSSEARRDGRLMTLMRGEIFLVVNFSDEGNQPQRELSFFPDFPLGSAAGLLGDREFDLRPEGDVARPISPTANDIVIRALHRETEVTFVTLTTRGTEVTDVFSLDGFSAAFAEAATRCGQ